MLKPMIESVYAAITDEEVAVMKQIARRHLFSRTCELSRKYYREDWFASIEYFLWSIVQNDSDMAGTLGALDDIERHEFRQCAYMAGGWLTWKADHSMPEFVPLAEWEAMYSEWHARWRA